MPEHLGDITRLWIEFADPADPDQMIKADLTWLTSRWQCIYGCGCPGIDAGVPHAGCCTFGAHFADDADQQRVAASVDRLTPEQWENHGSPWLESDQDGERRTRRTGGACILLNSPDFATGAGCALHVLAQDEGVSPVRTKPDVCWQLPIRRDYEQRERADGQSIDVVVITEYVRGMWGAGGHDLDWYCSANTLAHTAAAPVFEHSRAELVELVGDEAYEVLAQHCRDHEEHKRLLPLEVLGRHPADPDHARRGTGGVAPS